MLFFDGVCNLCNRFVNFLVRNKASLQIAPLQGESAAKILPLQFRSDLRTVVFWDNEVIYTESSAAIRALASIGGAWILLKIFLLIPPPLRNLIYRQFARRRYALFGKRAICRIPTPEEKEYFLP